MRDRVRSKSSTSCWKVGLWDGTACQQSLIIRYLKEQKTVFRQETWRRGIQIFYLSYSNATVISKHSPFVSPRGHQINLRGRQTINGTGQKKRPETTSVSDCRIFIKSFFYVVVSTNFTIYERRQHFNDATSVLQIIYKLPLQNIQFSELLSWRHFIIFVKLCLWLVLLYLDLLVNSANVLHFSVCVRTHRSCVQAEGFSMRCPSFSSLKSSSTGTPGYGDPPRVKISHSRTPNDHLQQQQHKDDTTV